MFCLSAIDSYSHLNVMKRLVNLIREEDNLIKLTEAKSIKTVKEILFNEAIEEENSMAKTLNILFVCGAGLGSSFAAQWQQRMS